MGDGRVVGHPLGMLILPFPCWIHGGREEREEEGKQGDIEEGRGGGGGRERGKQLICYIRETRLTNLPLVYSEHFPSSLPPFSASMPSN